MKRVLSTTIICSIVSMSLADTTLQAQPVTGLNHATYDLATGQIAPVQFSERDTSAQIWNAGVAGGYLVSMDWLPGPDPGASIIDWGDIADGSVVGGFQFAYATDLATSFDGTIVFWGDYVGFNNNGFYGLAGFSLTGLPGAVGAYNGWIITVDLEDPNDYSFAIACNDLDGDGLADFGYQLWFDNPGWLDSATGPVLANPDLSVYPDVPAAEAALGIEDAMCAGAPQPGDPNTFALECFWFGGWDPNDPNSAYAQMYLVLYDGYCDCCNPGASGGFCTADIDGSGDCRVGLSDLALLLADYSVPPPLVSPADFDGNQDVDLSDLAVLLAQYGDDCN